MSIKLENPMWFATPEFLVIVFPGLDPVHIRTSSADYQKVFHALTVEKDYPKVLRFVTPEKQISEKTKGLMNMNQRGVVRLTATDVDPVVRDYLPEFIERGWPLQPLVRLAENVHKIGNAFVRDQLVRFLRSGRLQITDDGCFIAYKLVRRNEYGKLVDIYSGNFHNNLGCTPRMPLSEVDQNPHVTCSKGLHVGTWGYMHSGFASWSSKVEIIAVKVNPADVVSAPYEYQSQKMRTCGYTVVKEGVHNKGDYQAPRGKTGGSCILEEMTGSSLIAWAKEHLHIAITISTKSKQRILLKIRDALIGCGTLEYARLPDGSTKVYL